MCFVRTRMHFSLMWGRVIFECYLNEEHAHAQVEAFVMFVDIVTLLAKF